MSAIKPSPLYMQLKEKIVEKIHTGQWVAGSKIPTEHQLCQEYQLSRITVRQALESLANDGYIVRQQGRGTFVSSPKIDTKLSTFYSFSQELQKHGFKQHDIVLSFRKLEADESIAAHLGVLSFCPVFAVERLRLIDDTPYVYETSYIPVHLCPRLCPEDIQAIGLYNSLEKSGNIAPTSAEESFEAVVLPNDVRLHLKLNKNSPALKIERTSRQEEVVFEYCISYLRGDRYKYTIYLKK